MPVAVYAGSFDPVHLGHLATIKTAATWFSSLYVVVAANPTKANNFLSVGQRVGLLAEVTSYWGNVIVASSAGLLVDFAADVHADVLVRTAGKEGGAEAEMAYMNRQGSLPTVFVPAGTTTSHISSSAVRALATAGRFDAVGSMVPEVVLRLLETLNPPNQGERASQAL